MKLNKEKQLLEKMFDVEYKTFSDLLSTSDHCFLIKQNKIEVSSSELCGLVAAWNVDKLKQSEATDLCSRFFAKLLKSPSASDKYKYVIKIFAASPVLLDQELLDNMFEAIKCSTDKEDVIVVVNEKNESLVRFLKLRNFNDVKTEFLISGQELLCKAI